jgi:glyoxylase I family protein
MLTPSRLDHVAYRCKNARETVDFYTKMLDMPLVAAVTDEIVQSTKERCPHIHVFFAMQDGSCVAFFELAEEKPMGRDENTPAWVQHLALQVDSSETQEAIRRKLIDAGVSVIGPKDGHLCVSIYFFDPNGHRLEITTRKVVPDEGTQLEAYRILEQWSAKHNI